MKTLSIVAVRPILEIEKPIVVFDVVGHPSIARNPKQALVDMQNSGRALGINRKEFDKGYGSVPQATKEAFVDALFSIPAGATISGEIREYKAGDEYVVTEGHPALTDKNHPQYNKVKLNGKLKAEKDGVYVDGFLTCPITPNERLIKEAGKQMSAFMINMFGFAGAGQAQVAQAPLHIEEDVPETDAVNEALGKK